MIWTVLKFATTIKGTKRVIPGELKKRSSKSTAGTSKECQCYKCGKKSHLNRECKAKSEENNKVVGLFGDGADENDEMEQAYMLEVDDGIIEDEEGRGRDGILQKRGV